MDSEGCSRAGKFCLGKEIGIKRLHGLEWDQLTETSGPLARILNAYENVRAWRSREVSVQKGVHIKMWSFVLYRTPEHIFGLVDVYIPFIAIFSLPSLFRKKKLKGGL